MTISRVSSKVWKINGEGNLYFLDFNEKIMIDTGSHANRELIEQTLSEIVNLDEIKKVIFTHMHYDHTGNFDLFKNADFFASQQAIDDFKEDSFGSVLDKEVADRLSKIEIKPLTSTEDLEVINTPGHTKGAICLWCEKEKILFSGDTILMGGYGRTDLPTSIPEKLSESLQKLEKYRHGTLCPGHEY